MPPVPFAYRGSKIADEQKFNSSAETEQFTVYHSNRMEHLAAHDMHPHIEKHSKLSEVVRDAIIGMSDGLTVPFAIAAGLASVSASDATIIVAAVLAEIAAGSVSMGLGGFLAAKTETDHYVAEREREEQEIETVPGTEEQEVVDALVKYGLSCEESKGVAASLKTRKKDWVDFMMRFELGLEPPEQSRAVKSAGTIAGAYIVGGFIPLAPYLFIDSVSEAFAFSVGVTFLALIVFGYLRGYFIGGKPWISMFQTVMIGSVAAVAAFLITKLIP